MLNYKSIQAVENSSFLESFCKPLYDSYCFSKIPGTVKTLFTGKKKSAALPLDAVGGLPSLYDVVILFFIDGFGWCFFEKYMQKYPFLRRFLEQGIVSKLTSQFPSTTAPHVTCINTGLDVGESGVYEWFYFEPKLDSMIAPLLFSFAGDKEINTLRSTSIAPTELYPTHTLYQDLQKEGISSYVMQHKNISDSPYSQVMFNGAHHIPYVHFPEALRNLLDLLSSPNRGRRAYFYLYFGDIDSMGHRYGLFSSQFERAMEECWGMLEDLFWRKKGNYKEKVACAVIADHGMVSVDPKKTYYLNREMPQIEAFLKKNREGRLIVPAGSCRDFFLHVKEERVEEAVDILQHALEGRAKVVPVQKLIDEGFFGKKNVSCTFLERVGNIVILPYENEAIWWYEKHRFEQHFLGAHGGLTKKEMETLFLFLERI